MVVMLTEGNLGAVNGLVTCICRSLAGNMEQNGAEVEISKTGDLRFCENFM
jgi:hypothetical protein